MHRTYLAFIDDAGQYQRMRSDNFNKRNPYYIKACVIIPADRWSMLVAHQKMLLNKYTGQLLNELKWNHIWKIDRRDNKHEEISYAINENFLKHISYTSVYSYVIEYLQILPQIEANVICTVTPNCILEENIAEDKIEKMHLQDIMQRIEMAMSEDYTSDNTAIMFCDQLNDGHEENNLRKIYHQIFLNGDFISHYLHIMDSLCFLCSGHSCGIQLADFIAGAFNGFLKKYSKSEEIFALKIYAQVRRRKDGKKLGYGIIDVPKIPKFRSRLEGIFKTDFAKYGITDERVIPF